jgi:lipid A 3-O-deacylase
VVGWAALALLVGASRSRAQEFRVDSVGMRGGFAQKFYARQFYEVEVFNNWKLPWSWDLGKEWFLNTRGDLSTGWLSNDATQSALGTVGPTFVLGRARLPLSLDVGISPTILSRHVFPDRNLGSLLQFTTHIGLSWDFASHWSLDYRFQHISNAGLAFPNPGLSIHEFGISYHF